MVGYTAAENAEVAHRDKTLHHRGKLHTAAHTAAHTGRISRSAAQRFTWHACCHTAPSVSSLTHSGDFWYFYYITLSSRA
eukprot:gene11440-biopygen1727